MSGQVIRQTERTAARKADGERRERIVRVQQCRVGHARLARMAGAVLPAGGRRPVREAANWPEPLRGPRPQRLSAGYFARTT